MGRKGGSSLLASLVDPFMFYGVIVDGGTLRSERGRKGGSSLLASLVGPFTFYGVVVDDGALLSERGRKRGSSLLASLVDPFTFYGVIVEDGTPLFRIIHVSLHDGAAAVMAPRWECEVVSSPTDSRARAPSSRLSPPENFGVHDPSRRKL